MLMGGETCRLSFVVCRNADGGLRRENFREGGAWWVALCAGLAAKVVRAGCESQPR